MASGNLGQCWGAAKPKRLPVPAAKRSEDPPSGELIVSVGSRDFSMRAASVRRCCGKCRTRSRSPFAWR